MKSARALLFACSLGPIGCVVPQQMLAAPADLADYRAFRLASSEGTRLARAQAYLRRHPGGAWADEVRGVFETEESAWFEQAKSSRGRAQDYVIDLPHGPHAEAARALLGLFDAHTPDIEMLELLADSRRTSASLDVEAAQRKQLSEVLLEEVAALIDPAVRGVDLDAAPAALARVLRGRARVTWGTAQPGLRDDDIYFFLRTPAQTQARVAEVSLRIGLDRGRVVGGTISGEDLFVRWSEANELRVLDASNGADRATAASAVVELLAGALEARFPEARCTTKPAADEAMARACDGRRVSVKMGRHAGDVDVIRVDLYPRARP